MLLAAGTPGKRLALPNARVLIHQPAVGGAIQGQVSDLEIQAAEIGRMHGREAALLLPDRCAHGLDDVSLGHLNPP